MANLDYDEELSDTEAGDVPFGDEVDQVDQVAMKEGTARVIEILGYRAELVTPSQIEQALWDSFYDADKAVVALAGTYAEEEAKMNDAAVDVLQRLGENSDKVTPKQMKDALWHYYYDIDKTVGYLDRTYINPPEKPKPKPKSPTERKYIRHSSSADYLGRMESSGQGGERATVDGNPNHRETKRPNLGYESAPRIEVPPEWHFWDTPWLGVPLDRQSVLVGPPRIGGLLGGSSKPSKLQALAAARKKKKESEGLAAASDQSTPAGTSPAPNKEIKLDIRIPSKRGPREGLEGAREGKLPRGQDVAEGGAAASSAPSNPQPESNPPSPPGPKVEACVMPQASRPSPFAATLFGSSPSNTTPQSYPLPYTSVPSFSANPFLQPSPDDIVLAAQSQGSTFVGK